MLTLQSLSSSCMLHTHMRCGHGETMKLLPSWGTAWSRHGSARRQHDQREDGVQPPPSRHVPSEICACACTARHCAPSVHVCVSLCESVRAWVLGLGVGVYGSARASVLVYMSLSVCAMHLYVYVLHRVHHGWACVYTCGRGVCPLASALCICARLHVHPCVCLRHVFEFSCLSLYARVSRFMHNCIWRKHPSQCWRTGKTSIDKASV